MIFGKERWQRDACLPSSGWQKVRTFGGQGTFCLPSSENEIGCKFFPHSRGWQGEVAGGRQAFFAQSAVFVPYVRG